MRFWIDTEFNSYQGDLISIGLVAEDGAVFYAVLTHHHMEIHPWVAEHVIPKLGLDVPGVAPTSRAMTSRTLASFLAPYEAVHIVADWPDDIRHFCDLLITDPGTRIDTPALTMEVRRDIDSSASLNPHNALADALAVRAAHWNLERGA